MLPSQVTGISMGNLTYQAGGVRQSFGLMGPVWNGFRRLAIVSVLGYPSSVVVASTRTRKDKQLSYVHFKHSPNHIPSYINAMHMRFGLNAVGKDGGFICSNLKLTTCTKKGEMPIVRGHKEHYSLTGFQTEATNPQGSNNHIRFC